MDFARVTAKGQTTIPKAVRERAGIKEGDLPEFVVEGDHVVVRKLRRSQDDDYLRGVEATLGEWLSDEDEAAYRDF